MESRLSAARLGLVVGVALAVGLSTLAPSESEACSCLFQNLQTQYKNADEVLRIRVTKEIIGDASGGGGGPFPPIGFGQVYYRARVLKDYKGCRKRGSWVKISTANNEAACGIKLQVGKTYVMAGYDAGDGTVGASLCSYTRLAQDVSASELTFLNSRELCCDGTCKCADGTFPVDCFVDPCSVTAGCGDGLTCESNYCGGCNAEFYDDVGNAACIPCSSAFECGFFGSCTGGICVPSP